MARRNRLCLVIGLVLGTYMCMQKVANSRDKGEGGGGGGDHGGFRPNLQLPSSASSPMLFRLDREREMSAMVSALTHVVSGGGGTSNSAVSASGGSWTSSTSTSCGIKRRREEHLDGALHASSLSSTICGDHFSHQVSSLSSSTGKFLHI